MPAEATETDAERAARKAEKRERRARKEEAAAAAAAASAAAATSAAARPRTRSFDQRSSSPVQPDESAAAAGSAWLGAVDEGAGWGAVAAGSKRRTRAGSEAGEAAALAAAAAAAAPSAAKRPRKAEEPRPSKDDREADEDEDEDEGGGGAAASAAAPAPRALTSFRMCKETVAALKARGVAALFPIQERTFDALYDGADLIGRARTGMGKTLAFVLPIVERLKLDAAASAVRGRKPRVIVMAPTRELAKQVADDFVSVQGAGLVTLVVYGGTGIEPQKGALWKGAFAARRCSLRAAAPAPTWPPPAAARPPLQALTFSSARRAAFKT
jgi:hypothetical protein